jgi:TIR domain
MPHEIELPQSLAPLSNCNAIEVTHIRFSEDVDQLIGVVGGALRSHKEERPERPSRPVQPSYRFEDSHQVMVFLCHASSDKPTVRTLRSRLLGDGIQPWLDEEDILPGQKWEVAIQKAIRSSDIILVCLSKTSINKVGYLQREISEVLQVADEQPEDSIFVIPARLEPCDVPERFRRWQWVDLFEELGYDRLMRTLRVAGSGELRK